jgi:inosose dehydratase
MPTKKFRIIPLWIPCLAGLALLPASLSAQEKAQEDCLHVACNQYPWMKYFQRDGKKFGQDWDASIRAMQEAGLDGFEAMIRSPEQFETLKPHLEEYGIELRSIYHGCKMDTPETAEETYQRIMAIAEAGNPLGLEIIVVNMSEHDKSDQRLRCQAKALDRIGAALREKGMKLAVHFHTPELEHAAREFRHNLVGTDPQNVGLCFDTHWIYRGSDDSEVAVFDVMKLFGDRVVELHLRQSKDGIWTETFGPGDIDYVRLAEYFKEKGYHPHIVLEQAPEGETPKTMNAVEALGQSAEYVREIFGQD